MKKIKCHNCSVELTENMDLQSCGAIFELFCSRECAIEFYMREMENSIVDVKNIRNYNKFAYVADGYIYHSDLKDDACYKCKKGQFEFDRFESINGRRYEIYICSECGNETRVKCK